MRHPLFAIGVIAALIAAMFALPSSVHVAVAAPASEFQQVTLAKGVDQAGEPMSLAVLPDRSVVHSSRDGRLFYTDASGTTKVAAKIPVYSHDEEGLQGIAADPDFATNRWIYAYYAPPLNTPSGDAPNDGTAADFAAYKGYNQLSRFKLGTDGTLDLSSEQKILQVPTTRGICCHVGGDIDFDAAGNLLMTTGDDSNPFASDGYSPLDTRSSRNPAFDAQRTAANSDDLRGKLLRIKVGADGSYSIPSGNLFAPGTAKTRPEIYAMGFRNPFRMSVDRKTGAVYIGDYGPDAGSANPTRGPGGQVEFDRVTGPGFYGWPYCTGTNTTDETYNHYDFATGKSGDKYDCQNGPVNDSPNNTGIGNLPAPKPAWIKYDNCSVPEFGCGSESPMGGPVYHYDAASTSPTKFPADYDGKVFLGEYGRRWIRPVEVKSDGSPGAIDTTFPWKGTQVMDMAFGPDGSLYVLDYGTGNFGGDANSALYRIDHIGANGRAPVAAASADKTSGKAPLSATFSSAGSSDPDGDPISYAWNFGDGGTSTAANPSHTYTANGQYTAKLTVTDSHHNTGTASVLITVGNTAPTVAINTPPDGRLFSFGDAVPWQVTVTDPEDGTIDCSKVTMHYILGHDTHGHPMTDQHGCSGVIQTEVDGEHAADANTYGVFDVEYTDKGANGQPALTTHAKRILQPRTKQAEFYKTSSGVDQINHNGAEGGRTVGDIDNGDWIEFDPYTVDSSVFSARVSSAGAGGTIEVRAGSPTGTLMGSVKVPVTGGWENFTTVSTALSNQPLGPTKLYLVFKGGSGALFDVDEFGFSPLAQAETFTSQSGVQLADHAPADGGKTVGYIDNGDWISFSGTQLGNVTGFSARVSSAGAGGTIEVHAGSATGPVLGSVAVPVTGSWENFQEVTTRLSAGQTSGLTLVFKGGSGALFDVDEFTLDRSTGPGQIVGAGAKCADGRDNTAIKLYTCDGRAAQNMAPSGDGHIHVLNKCVDVAGGGTGNGTKAQLFGCNTTGAQVWLPQADGTLKNPQSGRCLTPTGDGTKDGTPLVISDCTTGSTQKWFLP
ncbi:lectin [Actinoallomurus vinaceus]|uniref:Lectin n=1 Tax=Actinoallomurus vinaceus TaxID=1080074 RepID=A0ABP8URK5_9ACTN